MKIALVFGGVEAAWYGVVASTSGHQRRSVSPPDVQVPYYVRRHSSVESARTP